MNTRRVNDVPLNGIVHNHTSMCAIETSMCRPLFGDKKNLLTQKRLKARTLKSSSLRAAWRFKLTINCSLRTAWKFKMTIFRSLRTALKFKMTTHNHHSHLNHQNHHWNHNWSFSLSLPGGDLMWCLHHISTISLFHLILLFRQSATRVWYLS